MIDRNIGNPDPWKACDELYAERNYAGTPGPWKIIYHTTQGKTGNLGYIEIRGPNDEAICTIFPGAGRGGVGIETAKKNAMLLVRSAAPPDPPKETEG